MRKHIYITFWSGINRSRKLGTFYNINQYQPHKEDSLLSIFQEFIGCSPRPAQLSWAKMTYPTNLPGKAAKMQLKQLKFKSLSSFCQNPNSTTTQHQPNITLVGLDTKTTLHTPPTPPHQNNLNASNISAVTDPILIKL